MGHYGRVRKARRRTWPEIVSLKRPVTGVVKFIDLAALQSLPSAAAARRRVDGRFQRVSDQCDDSSTGVVRVILIEPASARPVRCAIAMRTSAGAIIQFLVDITEAEFERLPTISFEDLVVFFHFTLGWIPYASAGPER
jgi:hypothetical protein